MGIWIISVWTLFLFAHVLFSLTTALFDDSSWIFGIFGVMSLFLCLTALGTAISSLALRRSSTYFLLAMLTISILINVTYLSLAEMLPSVIGWLLGVVGIFYLRALTKKGILY